MRNIMFSLFFTVARPFMGKGLGRLPFVSRLSTFLFQRVTPKGMVEIKARGHKIQVDTRRMGTVLLKSKDSYESSVTQLLESIVARGMVVADIGASVGYHTLMMARLVGEEGRVFSFEPEPYSFELLVKNIKLNGYNNVCAVNKAVSDRNGKTWLFVPEDSTLKSRLLPDRGLANGRYIEIDMQTLDDFFRDYPAPDVVKMDAEGAEPMVLSGMANIIQRKRQLKIITEFNPRRLRLLGNSPEEYLSMLSGYGFQMQKLNDATNRLERVVETSALMDYADQGSFTNLYCTRGNGH